MENNNTLITLIDNVKNEEYKGITFILSSAYTKFVSYKELYKNAKSYLGCFNASGLKSGDYAVLQIEDNEKFLYAFWGCVMGGIIPIPLTVSNNEEKRTKLKNIFQQLAKYKILTTTKSIMHINKLSNSRELSNLCLMVDEISLEAIDIELNTPGSDDISYIQFSSGSTGNPKGVILTHENLISNINSIINGCLINKNDCGFSWLPLSHDMGLIGFHLVPLAASINHCIMTTSLFITNPVLWIENACKHNATILSSPNFGYKLFLESLKSKNEKIWNLSKIRLIFNGSEPISYELCNEFINTMSNFGLKENIIFPVYGLAEAALAVSFPKVGSKINVLSIDRCSISIGQSINDIEPDNVNAVSVIGLGYPVKDTKIRVTNNDNVIFDENIVGHIEISGKSTTKGYINNSQATLNLFSEDGWLRTGDLGFINNCQLFITGRYKDIIFINGQNYYSHDLEEILEKLGLLLPRSICIAGNYNDTLHSDEVLAFIVFNKDIKDFINIHREIKKYMFQQSGIHLKEVIPVKKIPKTTSGKFQRYKLIENYKQGIYDSNIALINHLLKNNNQLFTSVDQINYKIISIFSDILKIENIHINEKISNLNIDSLSTIQLISKLNDEFYKNLNLEDLINSETIYDLSKKINEN